LTPQLSSVFVKEVGISPVFAYNGYHMATDNKHPAKKPGGGKAHEEPEDRFLKAFDEYSDALFRHAMYRLSDRERAVELLHDTFTKAWGYLRGGHEIDSYKSFLYKVMNNLIIDEYRRRKETSLDAILAQEGVDEGAFSELHAGSIEEVTFSMDARRALDLINELPVVYREVIILRYVDGLGPKEISELIEETENVVSVRIHRALRLLRERIALGEEEAHTKRMKHTL
jgi:RNA polymerase sigma-70 factor, ECF subfamily